MPDDLRYHIMLLPRNGYWGWVQAARDFAVRFRVTLTPSPENALKFHRPEQVVSIADVPNAYSGFGSINEWFQAQGPEIRLDIIRASTTDQLRSILKGRIDVGQRFGTGSVEQPPNGGVELPITLAWPTDFDVYTQPFGANPQVYRRWGLPGHEGVDIRAPLNSNVYACADGEVYRVHDGSGNHAYGIHVRIQHEKGYKTIYAHLNQAFVKVGQEVKTGELIGLADSTGNSSGSHLHLSLKKDGASASGDTSYPFDLIDPTPFLLHPDENSERAPIFPAHKWPQGEALIGLHGRADGPMAEADWPVVQEAKVEALKLTSSARPGDVDRARQINPEMFILVRLFASFTNRVVPASEFARWIEPDMRNFYDKGIRYFEVHNEPNLILEGYGHSWHNGREFGEWFLQVIGILRPRFPQAKFGWPGLSPGVSVPGIRNHEREFLESAGSVVSQADWIACHCYWRNEEEMFSQDFGGLGYRYYREEYPDHLLFITEFSNVAPAVDWQTKGSQYLKYYRHLRNAPGVGGAFSFVVSASAGFGDETWRQENGPIRPVAGIVGRRGF